jgi:hypothetical protein
MVFIELPHHKARDILDTSSRPGMMYAVSFSASSWEISESRPPFFPTELTPPVRHFATASHVHSADPCQQVPFPAARVHEGHVDSVP